jgi:CRISPR/Cas system-associated protein Csm6
MKIFIEISDPLLEAARQVASREKTTVRALVEEGLRKIIEERQQGPGFKLRRVTFKGQGLQPEAAGASWERIRELIFEGDEA